MAEERVQRRLAAILAADVVGYSRLMGEDEAGTLDAMKAHRRELWTPKIDAYGGRVVGTAGDSILVEFQSAVAAVECSVAIQRGMVERNIGLPDDRQMLLRVGINIGEVVVDGEDIFGDGVNVAARLEALAEPGGICASDDVMRQIRGKLDLTFTDGGLNADTPCAAASVTTRRLNASLQRRRDRLALPAIRECPLKLSGHLCPPPTASVSHPTTHRKAGKAGRLQILYDALS